MKRTRMWRLNNCWIFSIESLYRSACGSLLLSIRTLSIHSCIIQTPSGWTSEGCTSLTNESSRNHDRKKSEEWAGPGVLRLSMQWVKNTTKAGKLMLWPPACIEGWFREGCVRHGWRVNFYGNVLDKWGNYHSRYYCRCCLLSFLNKKKA